VRRLCQGPCRYRIARPLQPSYAQEDNFCRPRARCPWRLFDGEVPIWAELEGFDMKRTVLFLVALLVFALMPAVASAQTDEEAAAIAALTEALDGVECVTVEGCVEDLAAVNAAVAALKALFPDLDYAALDGAIADLDAAITGGDLDEISAAADAVGAAGAAAAAAATAAAGEGDTTTTVAGATTTVAAPAAVDTGSPVDSGPNMALLGVAGLLVLLLGGALVLNRTAGRR
jgi:hypothetical protein